ncbi:tyrosine-protein kinase-like otk [Alligator mississippiensis]|uniref:Tyrosine-protein kinase-like otk n=1 Tax=Alligator mississippiensis TaxID=8496 RepID=A0A151MM59_ALLMI|nr:tyrosine-protein kinase-like otk [Alligator mississippiensis]
MWLGPDEAMVPEGDHSAEAGPFRQRRVDERRAELHVMLTVPGQGGRFQCQGAFDSGDDVAANIDIRPAEDPQIVALTPALEVAEGAAAEVKCEVTGTPTPTVTWERGGRDMATLGDRRLVVQEGTLVVVAAQPGDAGVYTCRGRQARRGREVMRTVTLSVLFSPRIETPHNSSVCAWLGTPVTVNFTVWAHPAPTATVAWQGKILALQPLGRDGARHHYALQVTPRTLWDFSSELVLEASNAVGAVRHALRLEQAEGWRLPPGSVAGLVASIFLLVLLGLDLGCCLRKGRGVLAWTRDRLRHSGKAPGQSVVNVSSLDA